MRLRWLWGGLWCCICLSSVAHPLAPALLSLRETAAEQYEVLWRTSVTRVSGSSVRPVLPESCVALAPSQMTLEDGDAVAERWTVRCAAPLEGAALSVEGLERAGVNVILRVERLGAETAEALLDGRTPEWRVPPRSRAQSVFSSYLALGVEHLLTGWDHLLFVTGLLLLVRGWRPLLWTVTAFTAGHSVTLAAGALGWVNLPSAPVEIAIALSIVWLACEIARGSAQTATHGIRRNPWIVALGFGLLHGLGFAGVLAETGLPPEAIPLALLAFNLGIEAGQVIWIAVCLGSLALLRLARREWRTERYRGAMAYGIGTCAAYWTWERLAGLWIGA